MADRFLPIDEDGAALDLATGEPVRIFVDAQPGSADIRERTVLCDRLAVLRHPLLVPLVDYGMSGRQWFEAHAAVPPLRAGAAQIRRAVLHVVRFLRANGIELTSPGAARNIRAALEGGSHAGRPIGVRLRQRAALDALRTVLEAAGPPGATTVDLVAPEGGGLRTARVQLARIARLAGYVVLDTDAGRRMGVDVRGRHVCAFEWMPAGRALPAVLAAAALSGGRRHLWVRFCRQSWTAGSHLRGAALQLEPMMNDDLTSAIYLDETLGPAAEDVRAAVARAHGWPGPVVAALTAPHGGLGAGWVHESAPVYAARELTPEPETRRPPSAGVARLQRAAEAARALAARGRHARAARILARCAPALAARGAAEAAAAAACDLGELLLDRGRCADAAAAFERARAWAPDGDVAARAVLGTGRVLFEEARLVEAEAVFRTAASAEEAEAPSAARRWLARALWHRGQSDAALATLCGEPGGLAARILLSLGRIEAAAQAAEAGLRSPHGSEPALLAEAHAALANVQAALRNAAGVRLHMDAAGAAAKRTRSRVVRLTVAAERAGCLQRCGVAISAVVRTRLTRAAAQLPALVASVIRDALQPGAGGGAGPSDLVQHFQSLIDAVHESADEATALQVMAEGVLQTLGACSAAIRSAPLDRIVAAAGRPWPGEEALARGILNGGAAVLRDGVTPEAAEAVRGGGAILGSIALRWIAGACPGGDRVREIVRATAVAAAPLLRAVKAVDPRSGAEGGFPDDLLGCSAAADRVRDAIRKAAGAPYPVLVEGESGSGKELVARAIHARGLRRARHFCAINCAALADDLLEAELFGHTRGAFTGAVVERVGLFEEADQGTLFLDEAGELSLRAQAKLLRVLQEGEVRRIGENIGRRIDVRIVAATNRSLEQEVEAGRFRGDLRFRLDVIRIQIPALRDRPDDLPWLVERIWADASARVGSRAVLGHEVIAALARYDWPGNVRELQNVLASLAVHGPRRGRVPVALLPGRVAQEAARAEVGFDAARLDFERRFVRAALARAGGRRTTAASHLGVSRQGLAKIIKRLGIDT